MNEYFGRNKPISKQIEIATVKNNKETYEDKVEISKTVAKANKLKYKNIEEFEDELNELTIIKEDSSELIVITKTKKLFAYVITITEKSPKKFRAVFINRMQNYCLDCLEYLIEANSLRMDSVKNKEKRKECQHNAFLKLKLLSYISFLALENECILKKQYEQISNQLADCINLLVAWRKSDALRFAKH